MKNVLTAFLLMAFSGSAFAAETCNVYIQPELISSDVIAGAIHIRQNGRIESLDDSDIERVINALYEEGYTLTLDADKADFTLTKAESYRNRLHIALSGPGAPVISSTIVQFKYALTAKSEEQKHLNVSASDIFPTYKYNHSEIEGVGNERALIRMSKRIKPCQSDRN